jgi:hypothetical protein
MVLHTTRADHGESGQNRSNLSSGRIWTREVPGVGTFFQGF